MTSTSNNERSPETYTMRGKSLDDCKEKINKLCNGNYIITGHSVVTVNKLFRTELLVECTYMLKDKVSAQEKEDFVKSKREILNNYNQQGTMASSKDISLLTKKLIDLEDKLESGLEKIHEDSVPHEVHKNVSKIEELLRANEFTENYISMMRDKMKTLSLDSLDDYNFLQKKVVDWIGESINIAKKTFYRPPHVIVIVGPTGVGKTTTIAKLGIKIRLSSSQERKENPSAPEKVVKYMTTDRMRIGAFEQLSKWVHAIQDEDEEVLVAEDCEVLKRLFVQYKSSTDYFLIDTSGFSPNDHENIAKMLNLFEVKSLHADINLAVSANTKTTDLKRILQNFEPFNYQNIIVTKCDETSSLGSVISVLAEKNKSVSYVTTGQNPSEIEDANAIFFLKNLDGFNIDREHLEEKFGKAQDNK